MLGGKLSTLRNRGALAVVVAIAVVAVPLMPDTSGAATSANLIKNPGAEAAPGGDGSVVKVPDWTRPNGSSFTVVKYGASGGFPDSTSPGPPGRGKNFFAGGLTGGTVNTASQTESLKGYAAKIDGGHVGFTLAGWFGGFGFQADNASLKVTWKDASGKAIGAQSAVGFVTPAARHNTTGLLQRSKSGTVPKGARSVLVQAICTTVTPAYDDGYLDNLSLVLTGA